MYRTLQVQKLFQLMHETHRKTITVSVNTMERNNRNNRRRTRDRNIVDLGTTVVKTAVLAYGTYQVATWAWKKYNERCNQTNVEADHETTTQSGVNDMHHRVDQNNNTINQENYETGGSSPSYISRFISSTLTTIVGQKVEYRQQQCTHQVSVNRTTNCHNQQYDDNKLLDTYEYQQLQSILQQQRKQRFIQCRSDVVQTMYKFLPTIHEKIITENDTKRLSECTKRLKEIRKIKTSLSQTQNGSEQHQQQSKLIVEEEERLWKEIMIITFTRVFASTYTYAIVFVTLTIQIHLIGGQLVQRNEILEQRKFTEQFLNIHRHYNDDQYSDYQVEDTISNSSEDTDYTNNTSTRKKNVDGLIFNVEQKHRQQHDESVKYTPDSNDGDAFKQSLEFLLRHTFERVLFNLTLPKILECVRESVMEAFRDEDKINMNDVSWNVLSPRSMHIQSSMMEKKINHVHSTFTNQITKMLLKSTTDANNKFVGLTKSSLVNCLVQIVVLSAGPTLKSYKDDASVLTDNTKKAQSLPEVNCNSKCTTPELDSSSEMNDDDIVVDEKALYHFHETLDLLESPLTRDAITDCVNTIIQIIVNDTWTKSTTTSTTSFIGYNDTCPIPTMPLASIVTEWKHIGKNFFSLTSNSANPTTFHGSDASFYCTRLNSLQTIDELARVCFQ